MNIEQQTARGVGRIRHVVPTGKAPDEKTIDRSEGQLTSVSLHAGTVDIVQSPADFGAREVGVQEQTGSV